MNTATDSKKLQKEKETKVFITTICRKKDLFSVNANVTSKFCGL